MGCFELYGVVLRRHTRLWPHFLGCDHFFCGSDDGEYVGGVQGCCVPSYVVWHVGPVPCQIFADAGQGLAVLGAVGFVTSVCKSGGVRKGHVGPL